MVRKATLIVFIVCLSMPVLAQDQDDAIPIVSLHLVAAQSGLPVEYPTAGIECLPDGRMVFANQKGATVHMLSNSGEHLSSFKMARRSNPLQMSLTPENELFIAAAGPAEGHYYSIDGRLLETVKLFEGVVDFSFAENGLVYSILGAPGKWYINVSDRLQKRIKKISFAGAFTDFANSELGAYFAPMLKGDEMFIVPSALPLIARFTTEGEYLATYNFFNTRFAESVEAFEIGTGKSLFTDIKWLGDDLLLCRYKEDHKIEFIRLSTEGKILSIYTYDDIDSSNRREFSLYHFCILNQEDLKIACLEMYSGDLYILTTDQ